MTDQELVFAIADHFGFDKSFSRANDFVESPERPIEYVDAECTTIPDYVWILGRGTSEHLLELLNTVKRFESTGSRSDY